MRTPRALASAVAVPTRSVTRTRGRARPRRGRVAGPTGPGRPLPRAGQRARDAREGGSSIVGTAHESARRSAHLVADPVAAVPAGVEQGVQRAAVIAHEDEALTC